MKITICGSMQFDPEMSRAKKQLEERGYEVDKPNVVEGHVYTDNLDANAGLKRGFIDEHFRKIDTSEAILVINEEKHGTLGYIGGNTLMELSYAYAQGLDLFLLNPVPEVSYADETRGMHPIVLDGKLEKIDEYIASLPLLYMSTESMIKHTAVARAMRRAGVPVRVEGKKVDSGVNEQPMSIDETYEGAMNRHANLKKLGVNAMYYATVESGQHPAHANHSLFGCNVVVLEKAGHDLKVGIDLDLEFPQEMLDKVPSQYPDLGVLVQQEYGATSKDPFPFFTGGRMTRQWTIEGAMYKLAVQLENEK